MGRTVLCLVLLLWGHVSFCIDIYEPVRIKPDDPFVLFLARQDSIQKRRQAVIARAETQLHVREKYHTKVPHYRNEHPQIYEYFRVCGFKNVQTWGWRKRAWCAAFVTWVLKKCGEITDVKPNMVGVLSWDAMTKKRLKPGEHPEAGDVVTYRPWSHMEFNKRWPKDPRIKIFYAVAGNTKGGRGYEGVHTNIPRPKAWAKNVIRIIPGT